jgi:hypothetical protein
LLNGNGEMTGTTWIDEAIVQSACRTVEYARDRRLPHRCRQLGQPDQSPTCAPVVAARLRRDVGRLPQRHQRRSERLVRTGTAGSHFSGDIFLAFSTADVPGLASAFPVGPIGDDEFGTLTFVPWGRMDDLYTAVVQAVEEAVLNALVVNDDMIGRDGHRSPALPHDRLTTLLSRTT